MIPVLKTICEWSYKNKYKIGDELEVEVETDD